MKSFEYLYTGHAGCILNIEGKNIAFDITGFSDPYCNSWFYYPEQFSINEIELDAVIVSHEHADHYDSEFLKKLSSHTKIFIIGNRPTFIELFQKDEIEFTSIPENKEVEIFKNVFIYGFVNIINNVDSSCLVYNKNKNVSLYHGNDHWIDLALLNNTLKKINISKIKYGMFPFCYVGWYPFCLELDKKEKEKLSNVEYLKHLDKGCMFVNTIPCLNYIPNGANLVHFSDIDSLINQSLANPQDFCNYFYKFFPQSENKVLPLSSSDFFYLDEVFMKKNAYSKQNIKHKISKFKSKTEEKKIRNIDESDIKNLLTDIQKRVNKNYKYFKTRQLVLIKPFKSDKIYKIDRISRKVSVCDKKEIEYIEENKLEYHLISFNDAVANYFYFKDKKRLESLIGARRVSIKRFPFNKKYCRDTFYWMSNL